MKNMVQDYSLISKQIKTLNKNGIYPLASKPRLNTLIVKRCDLERASALKISNEITIASIRHL